MLNLRLSRTALCISIPRTNGHRTAERVINTGTRHKPVDRHLRAHRSDYSGGPHAFVYYQLDREARLYSRLGRSTPRPRLYFAKFKKSLNRENLRRTPQSITMRYVDSRVAVGVSEATAASCARPLPLMYSHCEPRRALSEPREVFSRKLLTRRHITIKLRGDSLSADLST